MAEFDELLRDERLKPIGILSSGSLDMYGAMWPQSIQRLANAQTALVGLLSILSTIWWYDKLHGTAPLSDGHLLISASSSETVVLHV
jgi:hypothetical protein